MHIEHISSAKNPRIREISELLKSSRTRREMGIFVTEGRKELKLCLKGGFEIESLFINQKIADPLEFREIKCRSLFSITPELYSKIAYREGTEGVVATVKSRNLETGDIRLSDSPLIIVLESVEKPGNLGAVIRTAEASGVDAVIVCDPLTDLYNPNIIRSSTGAIFTTQCIAISSEECYKWLREKKIDILTTELEANHWHYNCDMTGPCAIVLGSESDGLSVFWREKADKRLKIPMKGSVDSLNVSVSAAIICFEAIRQRAVKQ